MIAVQSKTVRRILGRLNQLPPLPKVVGRVMELTGDPDFDMNSLVQTVKMDPAITARILSMCNSAFFARRHKVSSLEQAVPFLGASNLVDIALSAGMGNIYQGAHEGYKLARGHLWRHSMATALIAKKLGHMAKFNDLNALHTAALLHDIGKLVLSEFVTERFVAIEKLVANDGWPLAQAEKKVLKLDHAELGSMAAKKWKLTDEIRTAIAYHHSPAKADAPRTMTNLVSLANFLAMKVGAGGGFGDDRNNLPPTVLFELNLYPQHMEQLTRDMGAFLEKAEGLLSLAG